MADHVEPLGKSADELHGIPARPGFREIPLRLHGQCAGNTGRAFMEISHRPGHQGRQSQRREPTTRPADEHDMLRAGLPLRLPHCLQDGVQRVEPRPSEEPRQQQLTVRVHRDRGVRERHERRRLHRSERGDASEQRVDVLSRPRSAGERHDELVAALEVRVEVQGESATDGGGVHGGRLTVEPKHPEALLMHQRHAVEVVPRLAQSGTWVGRLWASRHIPHSATPRRALGRLLSRRYPDGSTS